ncbi:MAG: DNA polymerase I [Sumerlaeia bacterium]
MSDKKKLFLFDGHSHLYRAYFAPGMGDTLSTTDGIPTGAVFGFLQLFHRIRREQDPHHVAVVFDPSGPSFRNEQFEAYKANREAPPEDLHQQLDIVMEILAAMGVPMLRVARYEADDVLATLARWAVDNGGEACIVSIDKDLLQCARPGVTILRDHMGKVELLDEAGVLEKLGVRPDQVPAYLGMLGDTSDNIPGIPGVGKKRAVDLLSEFGDMESVIAEAQGKTKPKYWVNVAENAEQARLSLQLATIREDAPVGDVDWGGFAWRYEMSPAVREVYMRYELRKFLDEPVAAASFAPAAGGDLFGEEEFAPAEIDDRDTDYRTIESEADLARAVADLRAAKLVAVDTETDGLDPFTCKIVGISLSWAKDQGVYIPIREYIRDKSRGLPEATVRRLLDPAFADGEVQWAAHNWRFDYKMLARAGYPVGDIVYDTLIMSYLISPDRPSHSLKNLANEVLRIRMTEIDALIGKGKAAISMADANLDEVAKYACADADVTLQLRNTFAPQLADQNLTELFREVEMPLVTVLARMELEGIRILPDYFAELSVELKGRLATITEEIYELADGKVFNINSTKQLGEVLFEDLKLPTQKKTKSGYSTDVSVLEALSPIHPLPAKLLEYRQLEKLKGTYVDALPALINPKTGRVHSSFNQTVAATGRLSSSDPNLQNIPIRSESGRRIRRGFVPRRDGWVLLGADYSQIELRILAHVSKDPQLIENFRQDGDIHRLTASKMYHIAPDEVDGAQRDAAKRINFGIIYGMGAFRLSKELDIPRDVAQRFIDDYFAAYEGVRRFFEEVLSGARRNGYVTTVLGRRRYLPNIRSRNMNIRSQAERMAQNMPIQGTSADMIKIAMRTIDARLRREGLESRMIVQVHDELIFDCPASEAEAMKSLVREEMTGALPLAVPIRVDVGVGESWAELKG